MRLGVVMTCAALAACGGDDDPCAASNGTCVTLHVSSPTVTQIDALELDVLYGSYHSTVTDASGGTVALPVTTAIELAVTGDVTPSIVAAGKLGGRVLGTGWAKVDVAAGAHASLGIVLVPQVACIAGSRYCGGDKVAGDPDTVYECVAGGVPSAHGACPGPCVLRTADDDECGAVGNPCTDGGLYCGGDQLAGDPSSLYKCASGSGTFVMQCTNGCAINAPPNKDACR
ncbi:MAG: hypothetical protein ABI467_21590 [Kofleriaceae bacterium]